MTGKPGLRRQVCGRLLGATLVLSLASPAMAWNAAGHRISAWIAWEQLDEETRGTVDAILRQHPDFDRWQARSKGADPRRTPFVEASTWPDEIRQDRRFYTLGLEEPTATQAGFPDIERRLSWHYVDLPIGDASKSAPSSGVIDRQLAILSRTISDRKAGLGERAYALPWLIHLVGDAHQPLHTASRYGADGQSDNGGNGLMIINPFNTRYPSMNLHRYWDDLPGPPWLRDSRLEEVAKSLMASFPAPAVTGTPAQWIDESWQLAHVLAYPPGDEEVPTISAEFQQRSREIANRRVTEAGYRLAELLRQLLSEARAATGTGVR